MNSIRSFLTYALMTSIGLVIAVAIALSYQRTAHETEELYDAELAQVARLLETVLSIEFSYAGQGLVDKSPPQPVLIEAPEIHADGE